MDKAKVLPTLDVLNNYFEYNHDSGILTRKTLTNCTCLNLKSMNSHNTKWAGKQVLDENNGYIRLSINGIRYLAHRIIWKLVTGYDPIGYEIDHISGITTDNTLSNLRLANSSENDCNRGKQKDNKSGYKGVSWHKASSKWRAQISINRVKICLGNFSTPELAHSAYCKASTELHGEYANHG